MTARVPTIIVHGGAGAQPADDVEEIRDAMRDAVLAGWTRLRDGTTALDAVEAAVRVLEDHPQFNAGYGAVLTTAGAVELDASIMEGDRLTCGAVAAVSGVANPISLARRILEDGRHVLLVATGALEFARAHAIPLCDPQALITDRQRQRFLDRQRLSSQGGSAGAISGPPQIKMDGPKAEPAEGHGAGAPSSAGAQKWPPRSPNPLSERDVSSGTVGAVALDARGTVAAATSTGGTAGQLPGRVGDSALIGCGTYADSTIGGVSCTGTGEAIIRTVLGRRALDLLKEADDPDYAARGAVDILVEEGRGDGGLILLDWRGRMGFATSTPFMPVAWLSPSLPEPAFSF
jgi:beta-aspartyl-peptidase (threonine type)